MIKAKQVWVAYVVFAMLAAFCFAASGVRPFDTIKRATSILRGRCTPWTRPSGTRVRGEE